MWTKQNPKTCKKWIWWIWRGGVYYNLSVRNMSTSTVLFTVKSVEGVTGVTLLSGVINHLHLKWINSRLASEAVIRFRGPGVMLAQSHVHQNVTRALCRREKVWGLVTKAGGENSYWSFLVKHDGPGDKVGPLKLAINTDFNPSWRNKHQLPVTCHNCVG